ncbi:MAG: EAL domain-containing protein [Idiomarina sp.]
MKKKLVLGYSCLFAVFVVLVGCTFSAASLEGSPDDLSKQVIFSGSVNSPPLQWLDEQGSARGFFIDLQDNLGRNGEREVINSLMEWQDAMRAVETGEADAIALFASAQRSARYDFSLPFFHLAHAIFSHTNGEQFRNLADLEGYRVALVEDAFAATRLEQENLSILPVIVATELECLIAVDQGRADACIETTLVSKRNAFKLDVQQTSSPFWHQSYVFAVAKGNTEMLRWLNRQLTSLQADGTFFSIYKKWEPELEWSPPKFSDHLSLVAWIILPLLVVVAIGVAMNRYLKNELEKRTQELRYAAEHDLMTGLHNYQYFIDKLEKTLSSQPNWTPVVAFLRLNNLKTVASVFGRTGHEKLIKDFARRLNKLKFIETAHLGVGFYALVAEPGTKPKEIFKQLSFSCKIDEVKVDPHVVMGISSKKLENTMTQSLSDECVRRAIIAYAVAQRDNRSWATYTEQLEPDSKNLILLHDAQHQGTRDMFLVFQPKLDLVSGRITEAEALIRWNHPTLGIVSPAVFVPLLESTGLIRNVTRWVIKESIKVLNQLSSIDENFIISVNISSRDLMDAEFVTFITKNVDPAIRSRLCLEITETGIIDDVDHAQEVIKKLSDAGIRCAIDDFGTGHASLVYLSRFDITEVKLDRSYVKDILTHKRDREIVASTINLARKLGHRLTAEGVEDKKTLRALAEMKCDTAQGYVIAKPMSVVELETMIAEPYLSTEHLGKTSLV